MILPTTTIEVPEVNLESEGNTILQLEGPASVEPEVHTQKGDELVQINEGTGNEDGSDSNVKPTILGV